jgi:hypothetical protein
MRSVLVFALGLAGCWRSHPIELDGAPTRLDGSSVDAGRRARDAMLAEDGGVSTRDAAVVRPRRDGGPALTCEADVLVCSGTCVCDDSCTYCCADEGCELSIEPGTGEFECRGGGCTFRVRDATGSYVCEGPRPCDFVLDGTTGTYDCVPGGCVFEKHGGTGEHTCAGGGCLFRIFGATGGYRCDGGGCTFELFDAIGGYSCDGGGCTFCRDGRCRPCTGPCD